MKKYLWLWGSILVLALFVTCCSCGSRSKKESSEETEEEIIEDIIEEPAADTAAFTYIQKNFFEEAKNRDNCFFVISKVHQEHLSVYEVRGADTVLLCTYPVCIATNKGQKERTGDCKTPESYPGKPFHIIGIQDASDWHHDFKDGRGNIKAYGHWFMRLEVPGFSGIGIHGSTNNENSIAVGRGSEGCIRLYDKDIIHLKDHYAKVGIPVHILKEDMQPLPFEQKAFQRRMKEGGPKVEAEPIDVPVVKTQPNPSTVVAPPATVVAPPATSEASYPATVKVKGTHQQFRTALLPGNEYIYKNEKGTPVYVNEGDELPCTGLFNALSQQYYRVQFQGKDLYINVVSCYPAQ